MLPLTFESGSVEFKLDAKFNYSIAGDDRACNEDNVVEHINPMGRYIHICRTNCFSILDKHESLYSIWPIFLH